MLRGRSYEKWARFVLHVTVQGAGLWEHGDMEWAGLAGKGGVA